MPELDGSTILIVGATGGLGREIARLLAGAGATLVLSARDPTTWPRSACRARSCPPT